MILVVSLNFVIFETFVNVLYCYKETIKMHLGIISKQQNVTNLELIFAETN